LGNSADRSIVPSYYDRYQGGEHEAVWADLLALGNGVHEEPVYSDALAVARETMSRARTNIETLIVRLDEIGYQFETARDTPPAVVQQMVQVQRAMAQQLEALYPVLLADFSRGNRFEEFVSAFDKRLAPASTLDERSVYSRAQEWSRNCISGLETYLLGPLPVSLRAWYECVEHVSFIGSHPVLNPVKQEHSAVQITTPANQMVLPDPLAIMGLPDEVDYESWETAGGYPIAVDEFFKAKINRDHRYYIDFRDSRADTIFRDWRNDYFVAYLRRVFKWGGFPGLERHPNPPLKLIAELTDGLVAI
jgi:hypothetical protein